MTIEEEVDAIFGERHPERLADLGGVEFFRGREKIVAQVVLMPELLALVLGEARDHRDRAVLEDFVAACVAVPVGEKGVRSSDYKDAMEALSGADLRDDIAARCQDLLVRRARDTLENEVARWTALGTALQLALVHPVLRYDLLSVLVRVRADDPHPEFARRAATVAGVANAHWPDPALEKVLDRLSAVDLARDEALFELGLARLRAGLDADAPDLVDAAFEEARSLFESCLLAREHRPDAFSYARALAMLTALRRGEAPGSLATRAKDIQSELGMASTWSPPAEAAWPWLRAGWAELMRWQELTSRLADLAQGDPQASRAELTIRRGLLETYIANRAVLGRGPGGVEYFVKPTIEARLLREESIEADVLTWLENEALSQTSEWRKAASELLGAIRNRGAPPGKQAGTTAH